MKTNNKFTNTIINTITLYGAACFFLITIDVSLAACYGLEQSTYFSIPVNLWILPLYPGATFAICRNWVVSYNIRIKRKPGFFQKLIPIICFLLATSFGFLCLENKLSAYMHLNHSIIGMRVDTPVQCTMLILYIICIWSGIAFFKRGLVERPIAYNRYDSLNF